MKDYYKLNIEDVLHEFKTSLSGLVSDDISALQQVVGKNVLDDTGKKTRLSILASQFTDLMVVILIFAAGISFFLGEHTDAFVILAIIVANAWMGYAQELNAEKAIRLLQKMAPQFAMVIRNNHPVKVETALLVPGDIILLEAGDIVPADARLVKIHSFRTNEASLTGESSDAEKNTEAIQDEHLTPGDQRNMVFKGTQVSNGSAKAVVTNIGMDTEVGKIASLLKTGTQKTPLQKRLIVFSRQLAMIVLVICIAVFMIGLWKGAPVGQMFLTTLSLAVAALPEALPAVVTIALAGGAARLVKQKALIRRLPAVETLGSVTYICTDKTGTLTKNIMTVEKTESAKDKETLLMQAMLLNNEVRFSDKGLLGDATETALVDFALNHGQAKDEADKTFKLIAKFPFDSDRMRMSSLYSQDNKWILFVKGAPVKMAEIFAEKYTDQLAGWLNINREWAGDGLRVLFFGYKFFEHDPGILTLSAENDIDFLGIAAMIDPPREEVVEAIKQCRTAGIKTVMITGDQVLTATAIANRLGITNDGEMDVINGADLYKLTPAAFKDIVKNTVVYARVSPLQKLSIIRALQDNGEFVAMTGDGVNDAPSLKQADIGIAMGITGTGVSKESADMILLDDNFATIVKAVKEGRRIYANIRKFILYILSCNLGELLTILIAPVAGLPIPLLPIHILWMNLITDGLPGLALIAEPADKDIMNGPPRAPRENLFAGGLALKILLSGTIIASAGLFTQWWAIGQGYDISKQQTIVLTTLCFVQLGNALSVRSASQSLFCAQPVANKAMLLSIAGTVMLQLAITYVPFLQAGLKTSYLEWNVMSTILIITGVAIGCIEFVKYITKRNCV